MPPWLIDLLTNAGPVAGIMAYMWWRAEKRATSYEEKFITATENLPAKLMAFTEAQRTTNERLIKAVWAAIRRAERLSRPDEE